MSFTLTFLLVIANVLGAGMIVPQVIRLRRLRSVDGVSASGTGVGIAMNSWWVLYGIQSGAYGIIPVSAAGAALYLVIALQLTGITGRTIVRPILTGAGVIGMVPLVPYLTSSLRITGLVIGLLYGVQFLPAALAAIQTWKPTGISPATWAMAWIEAVIWLVYGSSTSDPALIVGGAGGTLMASVILTHVAVTRRRTAVQPLFR